MKEITGAGHYGFLIEVTTKKIKQSLQREFNNYGIELTVDQWVTLDQLQQADGISQNELGDKIFKDPPTVTRIIDLLVNKGFIERKVNDIDRRKFSLFLTLGGKEMIKQAWPVVLETRKNGWAGLSSQDYDHLVRILSEINRNFDNEPFFEHGLDQT